MEDFPPNSKASRGEGPQRQPREKVVQAEARRRKTPLGKKFSSVFIGGDAKTAWEYMIFESMIPAARDMIVDGLQSYIERLFTGNARPRGRGIGPSPYGTTTYGKMFRGGTPQHYDNSPLPTRTQLSRQARARHDFDEIILQTRQDAEDTLQAMYDILGSQYEVVTVADFYELVGIEPTHVDTTWGWTDLRGTGMSKVRGMGWVLDLPEPEHLVR
jgi:hypothetical protein